MAYNKTALQLAAAMFLAVVARKRGMNTPIYIKVEGERSYIATSAVYFELNLQELSADVRPVVDGSSVKTETVYFMYPASVLLLDKTEQRKNGVVDAEPFYTIDVQDSEFEEIFLTLSLLSSIEPDITETILTAIDTDTEIQAHYCKTECRSCRCTREKLIDDMERVFHKCGLLEENQSLFR